LGTWLSSSIESEAVQLRLCVSSSKEWNEEELP